MKEFWIYTGLRALLFVAAVAVVGGAWLLITGSAPTLLVLVIALVISGVGSYLLLGRQREALAQRVDTRAQRMTARFEESRTKEDAD